MLQVELNNERAYIVIIGAICLKLQEFQKINSEAWEIRAMQLQSGCKEVSGIPHYQRLLYLHKIVYSELISKYHNDLLIRNIEIDKSRKPIG